MSKKHHSSRLFSLAFLKYTGLYILHQRPARSAALWLLRVILCLEAGLARDTVFTDPTPFSKRHVPATRDELQRPHRYRLQLYRLRHARRPYR